MSGDTSTEGGDPALDGGIDPPAADADVSIDDGDPTLDGGIDAPAGDIVLWHEVDTAILEGGFLSLGDLDNDGRVDFLLYRQARLTTPGRIAAVDFDGNLLWEIGDATLDRHLDVEPSGEPPVRGIAFVFDIDTDGLSEVVTELWEGDSPGLLVLDGATGEIEHAAASPLDLGIRLPEGYAFGRGHPVGSVAFLDGPGMPPSIVLKYESSGHIPGHVFALDADLGVRWHAALSLAGAGHIPTVADIDGDGRDEIVAGEAALDDDGGALWERPYGSHADMTAAADVHASPGVEVLMSICGTGPVACMSPAGDVLWEVGGDVVTHGQGVWAGDFVSTEAGWEVIALRSGHSGQFITLRGSDGGMLGYFEHSMAPLEAYPDLPVAVGWLDTGHLLWIPADRVMVDGRGHAVQDLGPYDGHVVERLHPGTTKTTLAVQAFPLDLCGDEKDEIVLYHPYAGEGILIFSRPDTACASKPYAHEEAAYNIRSYF